jgi:hypothetical protein
VHVVGHECIAERFDGENAGQFFDARADPLAAMGEIAARSAITPAKMIAADAAADGVKHLNIGLREDFPAIHARHKKPFRKRLRYYKRRKFGVKVHGTFDVIHGTFDVIFANGGR